MPHKNFEVFGMGFNLVFPLHYGNSGTGLNGREGGELDEETSRTRRSGWVVDGQKPTEREFG